MASKKVCFVTVGATATFNHLVEAVLGANFLASLKDHGFTDLLIQYGAGKKEYERALTLASASLRGLNVSGFDLDRAGLDSYMRQASGTAGGIPGVVISHAGSGTVLDALRVGATLVVVPNTSLLDNHQVELAEALAAQGYVVHGRLEALPRALSDAAALTARSNKWPPVNSGKHRGIKAVLDEEMGFLD